jgi:hypothetical protein
MFSKLTLAAAALFFVSRMYSSSTETCSDPALVSTAVLATNANCTRTYTVVAGDICDGISRAMNVSTYQLAAVNSDIIDAQCGNLQIGEQLCKLLIRTAFR